MYKQHIKESLNNIQQCIDRNLLHYNLCHIVNIDYQQIQLRNLCKQLLKCIKDSES